MAVIGTVALLVTTDEIISVRAGFGKVEGLRGVSLTIQRGEFFSLPGAGWAWDALHDLLRSVIVRSQAVWRVASLANRYGYCLQNTPSGPFWSARHSLARVSYAESP